MSFILKKTITETFLERVRNTPLAVGFQYKPTSAEVGPLGQWKKVSFKEFYTECRWVSFGLMGLGIQPRDHVAILSNSRYEWSLSDMAILGAGGITVPLYASNTADDILYIAQHAEVRVIFLEDITQLKKIWEKRSEDPACLPLLRKIVVFDSAAMVLAAGYTSINKDIITLQALKELGRREEIKNPDQFDRKLSAAKPEDLITVCYTSGTTGVPKGVMITHDNLMSTLEDCAGVLGPHLPKNTVVLSFLPFSHIFGKVESLAIYTFGWREVFAENLEKLMANIAEIKPDLIFSVPRIFEKGYNKIQSQLDFSSPSKKLLFQWAMKAGREYYNALWEQKKPGVVAWTKYQLAKNLVFGKVAQLFGGRLCFAVCGGAPLPREIGEFFQIAGIRILEGYGLTETCAPVTVNTPFDPRFGTVGRPLPEVALKLASDGEILVKSRKIFKGYYKMEDETVQVMKEGWFYTGDIGKLDSEGFLSITDRKKDLIVTSGGKNIAPQKIENLAKSQKFISQFVVHGDRRHYLTALVTLDREQVILYANENQVLFSEYSELVKNPKILSLTQKMIDEVNKRLAGYESIKKFVILPAEFSVEGGELTPSLKIRRRFVNELYSAELDSMYRDSARVPLDSSSDIR